MLECNAFWLGSGSLRRCNESEWIFMNGGGRGRDRQMLSFTNLDFNDEWFARIAEVRWTLNNFFIKLWIYCCCAISYLTLKSNLESHFTHCILVVFVPTWDSQFEHFFSRFIWSTHCSAESIGDTLCWARLTDLPQTKEDVQGIAYTHARESSEKKEAQTTYLKQKPANIIYFIFLLEAMHN